MLSCGLPTMNFDGKLIPTKYLIIRHVCAIHHSFVTTHTLFFCAACGGEEREVSGDTPHPAKGLRAPWNMNLDPDVKSLDTPHPAKGLRAPWNSC